MTVHPQSTPDVPSGLRARVPASPFAWFYIVAVAATAGSGFAAESTSAILIAAALTLPASIVALPGYYVLYGLLSQVTGGNSDTSRGSASCSGTGECITSTAGGLPPGSRLRPASSESLRSRPRLL